MAYLLHARIGEFHVASVGETPGHRFERHSHDDFVISANLTGQEDVWLDGKVFQAQAGDVTVYNPGEIQGGGSPAGCPWRFVSLYVDPLSLEAALQIATPLFQRPLLTNPTLAARLADAVHAALSTDAMIRAASEEALLSALGGIAREGGMRIADCRAEDGLVRKVKRLLSEHLDESPSLDDLAAAAGLSKYHLLRAFTRKVGMSPRRWAMQLRTQRAMILLRQGGDPAEIAATLGFTDQSHLTRHFLRAYGITPARYREAVR